MHKTVNCLLLGASDAPGSDLNAPDESDLVPDEDELACESHYLGTVNTHMRS